MINNSVFGVVSLNTGPTVIKSTKILYVDIDSTLVLPVTDGSYSTMAETVISINGRDFIIHEEHVETIKDFNARGHTVVLWSAGGSEWAYLVMQALDLTPYIDLVISKPDWIIDDLPASKFIAEDKRFFKETANFPFKT